jgi:nitrate/nitrite transporter NarK
MQVVIALGLILGSWASGICGWYLWFTRPQRRVRNQLVTRLGQVAGIVSSVGSLFVFLKVLERMNIARHTAQYDAALFSFALTFACVTALTGRREFKWRKSVGLHGKEKSHGT